MVQRLDLFLLCELLVYHSEDSEVILTFEVVFDSFQQKLDSNAVVAIVGPEGFPLVLYGIAIPRDLPSHPER
jgi:hypothetical protein